MACSCFVVQTATNATARSCCRSNHMHVSFQACQVQNALPWDDLGVQKLDCMQPWVLCRPRCSGFLFVPIWSTSSRTRDPRVFPFIPPSDQKYRYWDALVHVPLAMAPKETIVLASRWHKMCVKQRELPFSITVQQPPVGSLVSYSSFL